MDYSIEPRSQDEYIEYVDFPDTLSYFFEQIGGYGEKSIVSQLEKILNIDLSIFQKTYNPEMEMDFEEFESELPDEYKNNEFNPDDYWIAVDSLIEKLNELKQGIENNNQYFSEIIFNPKDRTNRILKMDILDMIRSQEENALSLYPVNNGIITDESLKSSISELVKTLENLKNENIEQIRLNYG